MQKINRDTRLHISAGKDSGFEPEQAVNIVYLAKPAPLYALYPDGEEVLIGFGHEHKFQLDEWEGVRIWSPVQGNAIVKPRYTYEPQGEVYTNFDKRPSLSPLEASITLALRKLKAEQRHMAAERAKLDREALEANNLTAQKPPEEVPAPAPAPEEPAADPVPAAE